jgi:hypothetical protein
MSFVFTAEGMRNQEIAPKLNLSEHTVRNYLIRIFDKLGISNPVELVLYALSGAEDIENVPAPLDLRDGLPDYHRRIPTCETYFKMGRAVRNSSTIR